MGKCLVGKCLLHYYMRKYRNMTMSGTLNSRHYTMDLSVGDFSIPVTEEETDLGVVFS